MESHFYRDYFFWAIGRELRRTGVEKKASLILSLHTNSVVTSLDYFGFTSHSYPGSSPVGPPISRQAMHQVSGLEIV